MNYISHDLVGQTSEQNMYPYCAVKNSSSVKACLMKSKVIWIYTRNYCTWKDVGFQLLSLYHPGSKYM